MADPTTSPLPTVVDNGDQTRTVTWNCTGNASGGGAEFGQFPDRTFGVTGTFGSATVVLKGSFDGGTTWIGLHDFANNAVSFTAAGMSLVAENPPLIAPFTSGGTSTVLVCSIMGMRNG